MTAIPSGTTRPSPRSITRTRRPGSGNASAPAGERYAWTWPAAPGVPAGYGTVGWASRGSGDGSRIGGRVGFHHKTLAGFLQAFMDAGLALRSVREFVAP